MKTAVQFGAGNIGRGFLAQLFHESGFDVVFVDVADDLVEALNARGEYTIHIVAPRPEDVRIDRVSAIHGRDRGRIAEAVAECEIACTAVGAAALEHVAASLAQGLARRYERHGGPLNVLICENLPHAAEHLRSLTASSLPASGRDAILAGAGFVQAVVSRMVPLQQSPPEDPLSIRVEAYKRLPVDGAAVVGALPDIVGVEPVANFQAHAERKLYIHNCLHAALGYAGYLRGWQYGFEALKDPYVKQLLDAVIAEVSEALIRRHGFDVREQREHVNDLLARFGSPELGDTCFRLARDPLRKLQPEDRLVGAARLSESQGIRPRGLARAIAAALHFDSPLDPSAVALQKRIAEEGVAQTLQAICRISPEEDLGVRILKAIQELQKERDRVAGNSERA